MRLGLIGPAEGNLEALERGATLLLKREAADRVIYLGADDALDVLVLAWAERLVGGDPTDDAIWDRAAARCAQATHQEIDQYLEAERARDRLKALECLPRASSRSIEMFDGRLAVILYDKALLDEEDILPATILVFGKSTEPLIRRVGPRTFIAPGPLSASGGVALLSDDEGGTLSLSFFEPSGARVRTELIAAPVTTKMRVIGESSSNERP